MGHANIADLIGQELPYLRRYARALTGNQKTGDTYAAATLEAILEDRSLFDAGHSAKVALFKAFNQIWVSSGAPVDQADGEGDGSPEARAQWRMAGLTKHSREVLLLHAIEGLTTNQIGEVIGVEEDEAVELLRIARSEMAKTVTGRILVIEDEAIIAMDIMAIVEQMGHHVTGNARTRDAAIEMARKDPPDMILADIQLADKSSGIDAVAHILKEQGDVPVVFITAFPERLLTGERPEPAFLITKPYSEEQVHSAVSQAMFFASSASITT
ncbi:response regulator [Roseovarius pelagicus]|uniref:Response regulator n=2 Tax=Roseovarius pelagicus TaxID=2980108 RepID=A0ABY6DDA3_9RHOB|nr:MULTISPECIES: response regulator [Rhodobacterales]UXX84111.1 response regulator [Roseovarius pelagicus]